MNEASSGYRIEKDLLGEKAVPASAYYGIHTLRAMENFKISGRVIANLGLELASHSKVLQNSSSP